MELSEYDSLYKLETGYWWYKALHELVEFYIQKLNSKGSKILDAGCGTGGMLDILKRYGTIEGIDSSEKAISFCKKKGLRNVKLRDLNNWQYCPNHYNAIVSLDVLAQEGIIDDIAVMHKIFHALNTGGIFILNVTAFNCLKREHDIVVSTLRRYKRDALVAELKKIGFNIETATYRLPYLFVLILIRKLFFLIFKIKKDVKSDLQLLPGPVNALFLGLNRIENKMIVNGLNMPFGSSLFIVARKS